MIGIYGIRNKLNGKTYVGQSINISERWAKHKYQLNKNIHINKYLQNSWNLYGKDTFVFEVLKKCDSDELSKYEENIVLDIGKEMVYNISEAFSSMNGEKIFSMVKKHSDQSKQKMSKWKKENFLGSNNPNFGNKQSKEVVLKMVVNNSPTKLTVDKVKEIVELLKEGLNHQQIADKFLINRTVVTRISNGTRWVSVTGGPVISVVYENGKRLFTEEHKNRIGKSHKGMKYLTKK